MDIEKILFPIVLITYITGIILYTNYKHKKE